MKQLNTTSTKIRLMSDTIKGGFTTRDVTK